MSIYTLRNVILYNVTSARSTIAKYLSTAKIGLDVTSVLILIALIII